MARAYGLQPICPDDGGLLLAHADWGDRLHCPNNGHGGNGRFFAPGEETRGEPAAYRAPKRDTERAIAAAIVSQAAIDKQRATETARSAREDKAHVAPRPKRTGEPKPCTCGCGGMTKGGRFLPGHDSKYHARLKAEAKDRIDAANLG